MDEFELITKEMHKTFLSKNLDYGNSFDRSCDEFGLISPIIRMQDKLSRLKQLTVNHSIPQVQDEKLSDTLLDLANYAIMTVMWLNKHDLSSK